MMMIVNSLPLYSTLGVFINIIQNIDFRVNDRTRRKAIVPVLSFFQPCHSASRYPGLHFPSLDAARNFEMAVILNHLKWLSRKGTSLRGTASGTVAGARHDYCQNRH